jgi:hypothetical protein
MPTAVRRFAEIHEVRRGSGNSSGTRHGSGVQCVFVLKSIQERSSLVAMHGQRHSPPRHIIAGRMNRYTAPPAGAKGRRACSQRSVLRASPDVSLRSAAASAALQADHKMARITARARGRTRARHGSGRAPNRCAPVPWRASTSSRKSRWRLEGFERVARPRAGEAAVRKPVVVAAGGQQRHSSSLNSGTGTVAERQVAKGLTNPRMSVAGAIQLAGSTGDMGNRSWQSGVCSQRRLSPPGTAGPDGGTPLDRCGF